MVYGTCEVAQFIEEIIGRILDTIDGPERLTALTYAEMRQLAKRFGMKLSKRLLPTADTWPLTLA